MIATRLGHLADWGGWKVRERGEENGDFMEIIFKVRKKMNKIEIELENNDGF